MVPLLLPLVLLLLVLFLCFLCLLVVWPFWSVDPEVPDWPLMLWSLDDPLPMVDPLPDPLPIEPLLCPAVLPLWPLLGVDWLPDVPD